MTKKYIVTFRDVNKDAWTFYEYYTLEDAKAGALELYKEGYASMNNIEIYEANATPIAWN